jgi:hypothetical protein
VIGPTGALRVMVATKPVDFRKVSHALQFACESYDRIEAS